jgi:hypothetical protein
LNCIAWGRESKATALKVNSFESQRAQCSCHKKISENQHALCTNAKTGGSALVKMH